jgi:hypothetical protein
MSTLKVQEIQHTGGTTAQTIDSSGRILTPARPAFRARIAGSTGSHGDTGVLVFETEDFDIGGNYNTSTGIFTVPTTGLYHIMFRCLTSTNASGAENTSGEYPYGDFLLNGTGLSGGRFYHYVSGAAFHATLVGNSTSLFSSGDEVKVSIGGEFAYSDTNPQYDPCFEGYLIG